MSAKPIMIWTAAGFIGLWAASSLAPADVPVSSLDASLGPEIVTEPL